MKVFAQVIGGEPKEFTLDSEATVQDLVELEPKFKGYSASVKGTPVDNDEELEDYDVVVFTEKIKGA